MKHLKLFEEFSDPKVKQFPKREFDEITKPIEPFKRDFTKEETMFLHRHFPEHSWSKIDAEGRIILGGGEFAAGKFYITEDDLAKFMEEEKDHI